MGYHSYILHNEWTRRAYVCGGGGPIIIPDPTPQVHQHLPLFTRDPGHQ